MNIDPNILMLSLLFSAVGTGLLMSWTDIDPAQEDAFNRWYNEEHIGRLPITYYDSNKTGQLVSRIMSS